MDQSCGVVLRSDFQGAAEGRHLLHIVAPRLAARARDLGIAGIIGGWHDLTHVIFCPDWRTARVEDADDFQLLVSNFHSMCTDIKAVVGVHTYNTNPYFATWAAISAVTLQALDWLLEALEHTNGLIDERKVLDMMYYRYGAKYACQMPALSPDPEPVEADL